MEFKIGDAVIAVRDEWRLGVLGAGGVVTGHTDSNCFMVKFTEEPDPLTMFPSELTFSKTHYLKKFKQLYYGI